MTWIKTVSMPERGGTLRLAGGAQIVESHSLVAEASNRVTDSLGVGQ